MKRLICLCCFLCVFGTVHAQAVADRPSVLVQTTSLVQRDLSSHITGFGILTPEPDATHNLNFPIAGRVDQVLVNPGQLVNKGDWLLTVSADPATTLNYSQAKNTLNYARTELVRQKNLFQQQLTTRSQLDNAVKNLKDAEDAMAIQKRLGAGIRLNKLTATITGIVTSVSVVPGDRFTAGTNLMQIASVDTLRAQLGVEPSDSHLLQCICHQCSMTARWLMVRSYGLPVKLIRKRSLWMSPSVSRHKGLRRGHVCAAKLW